MGWDGWRQLDRTGTDMMVRLLNDQFGQPRMTLPDEHFYGAYVGMTYEVRNDETMQSFIYILKSKDEQGNWQLEWPD